MFFTNNLFVKNSNMDPEVVDKMVEVDETTKYATILQKLNEEEEILRKKIRLLIQIKNAKRRQIVLKKQYNDLLDKYEMKD
jgi:sulfur carrier protein ThiS